MDGTSSMRELHVAAGMWHLILHVNDEEWADVKLPTEEDVPEEVCYVGLCKDEYLK